VDGFSRQSPLLAAQNHQRFLSILEPDGLTWPKVGSQSWISHQLAPCYRLHADKYVRCLPVFLKGFVAPGKKMAAKLVANASSRQTRKFTTPAPLSRQPAERRQPMQKRSWQARQDRGIVDP